MLHIFCLNLLVLIGTVWASEKNTILAPPFKIGSFNVRTFGSAKMSKPEVVDVLKKIISSYDILTMQEVRDSKGKSMEALLSKINSLAKAKGKLFKKVFSERLGRSTSKEQYVFFYNANRVSLIDTFQYKDTRDYFERPPFSARFHLNNASVSDIVIIAMHIKPADAEKELNYLAYVHGKVEKHWKIKNIVIAGDMNADCTYLSPKAMAGLKLRSSKFLWLINRCHGTTTVSTVCLYDHFIVSGQDLLQYGVVPDSAKVVRFEKDYKLDLAQTLNVSDHFPIEFNIAGESILHPREEVSASSQFSVRQTIIDAQLNSVRKIYRAIGTDFTADFDISVLKRGAAYYKVIATKSVKSLAEVVSALNDFGATFTGVLNKSTLDVVSAYLANGQPDKAAPHPVTVTCHSRGQACETSHSISVDCYLKDDMSCSITVQRRLIL